MTKEARGNFEAALALDAATPMSRYYLGLAAAQDGEKDKAFEILTKLAADAPAGAPMSRGVRAQLAKLRGEAKTRRRAIEARSIAALPEDHRQAMIRGMVDRLAGRLEQQGDDVEGWLKLIRAYSVLAEPRRREQALAARARRSPSKTASSASRRWRKN